MDDCQTVCHLPLVGNQCPMLKRIIFTSWSKIPLKAFLCMYDDKSSNLGGYHEFENVKTHIYPFVGSCWARQWELLDRKEKYEIHKYRNATLAFVELARVGRKHKSPQTVIAASKCTHPECSHCIGNQHCTNCIFHHSHYRLQNIY